MEDGGWSREALEVAKREGTGAILFLAGAAEIDEARDLCSGKEWNEDSELPEDQGIKKDFFFKFLAICMSSTDWEDENRPDYNIEARIVAERAARVKQGMTVEEAEALIPALIFLTTNTIMKIICLE